MRRNWTKEEEEYLQDKWGAISIKGICENLNRSTNSVKLKAYRMNLSDPTEHFDGITLNQLSLATGIPYTSMRRWTQCDGFPSRKKLFCKELRVVVVRYEYFWKWAEKNKSKINFAKFEPFSIGPEPEWVKEKRDADIMRNKKPHNEPWTKEEDNKLLTLISHQKYSYSEIALRLNRTEAGVKRRLYDIKHPGRPVRRNNHIKYTEEEIQTILDMLDKGYSLEAISHKTGKTALGIRGKLERMDYQFKKAR